MKFEILYATLKLLILNLQHKIILRQLLIGENKMINLEKDIFYFHKIKENILQIYKNKTDIKIENFYSLFDENFHFNLYIIDEFLENNIKKRVVSLKKHINIAEIYPSKTEIPYTSSLFFIKTINNFKNRLYYQSLISIPEFDGILGSLCVNLGIPSAFFESCPVNNYIENKKSSHSLVKLISSKYQINPLLDMLFSDKKLDLRSQYSHFKFKNKEDIRVYSYLYILLIIDIFYLGNRIVYL